MRISSNLFLIITSIFLSVISLNTYAMDPSQNEDSDIFEREYVEAKSTLISLLKKGKIEEAVLGAPFFWSHEEIIKACEDFSEITATQLAEALRKYAKFISLKQQTYPLIKELLIHHKIEHPDQLILKIRNSASNKFIFASKQISQTYKTQNILKSFNTIEKAKDLAFLILNWSAVGVTDITLHELISFAPTRMQENKIKTLHDRNQIIERRLYFDTISASDVREKTNFLLKVKNRIEEERDYNGAQIINNILRRIEVKSAKILEMPRDDKAYIPSSDYLMRTASKIREKILKVKKAKVSEIEPITSKLKEVMDCFVNIQNNHSPAVEAFFPLVDIPMHAIDLFMKKQTEKSASKIEMLKELPATTCTSQWYLFLAGLDCEKSYEELLRIGISDLGSFYAFRAAVEEELKPKSNSARSSPTTSSPGSTRTSPNTSTENLKISPTSSTLGHKETCSILLNRGVPKVVLNTISLLSY